jgi:TonB family protein
MRLMIAAFVSASLIGASGAGLIAQSARQVYKAGNGVTLPEVVKDVRPGYTSAAMAQRIEGIVLLDAVVEADGKVNEVTVAQSLDMEFGLDEQAVNALKAWEFKPGTREGKPVAVQITVQMSFTLK